MRIPLTTMYGATETQGITVVHWLTERVGLIGLPLPGITLKLVPNGTKLEVRVKGPTVTPGYHQAATTSPRPRSTRKGYYSLGDAAKFVDETDPAQGPGVRRPRDGGLQARQRHLGIGRHVARARRRRRLAADVRIAWSAARTSRSSALLAWPNVAAAKEIAASADPAAIVADPEVRDFVREKFAALQQGAVRLVHAHQARAS